MKVSLKVCSEFLMYGYGARPELSKFESDRGLSTSDANDMHDTLL